MRRRGTARGGGEGRAGREIGVDEKIFSARSPFPPCLAEIALKSSRLIVREQRIWYNACVLPKWEDHREAGTLTSRRRREEIPVAFSF